MFTPPFCPLRSCSNHRTPTPDFFVRHGSYTARCRSHPVPRFRCRGCRRTFSRQTFRMDFHDKKPHLNAPLFQLLASGIGLRQSSRLLGLTLRCTELKFRKIARHLRRLNLNLRRPLEGLVRFHLDEFETYEGERNTRPLSVPVLVESESRFLVWAEAATIRPRGKMTKKRVEAIERAAERYGPRQDRSRRSLRRTLTRGRELLDDGAGAWFDTDEKSSYPDLIRSAFEGKLVGHRQTNSKQARTTWNPLFPVNHEEALMRDLMGRVRRESWLVSKMRRYLDLGLQVHMAYRNLVRRRFNFDEASPAQLLGFARRRLRPSEALSWRQDWGERSLDPLSRRAKPLA